MLISCMRKADAVLAVVRDILPDDARAYLEFYQNGREHGYAITNFKRKAAFSECRNSDDICIYFGTESDFEMAGNVPVEATYRAKRTFRFDAYVQAATAIVQFVVEGKVQ